MDDKKIRYIVRLKESCLKGIELTTLDKHVFCGYIENISDRIYFRVHGSEAIVIVPHNAIEWMAPSKRLWEKGFKEK